MSNKITALLEWARSADDDAIKRTGTTRGYLLQIAYGNKTASPVVASKIEIETDKLVTRQQLRSSDWRVIWPELATP